jgi:lipid-binding SYLF domain-containing protein
MTIQIKIRSMLLAGALLASFANNSIAGPAREEVRLQTATQVLEEVQAMPDQRLPDSLLAHAYGIAVIPNVTQIALIFGGRHGNGVLTMRDTLNSPWSNPVFVSLTGASGGLQVGMEASDIILVFTTKSGVDGIALGKLTLGADASVAAGPVGRQATAATDVSLAEIYSYARTRGLFGGIAFDGSALAIDKSANRAFYGKPDVTASEILSGSAPTPPETAQRFLSRLAKTTHSAVRGSPAPQADIPAAAQVTPVPAPTAPAAEARTYPLESQSPN